MSKSNRKGISGVRTSFFAKVVEVDVCCVGETENGLKTDLKSHGLITCLCLKTNISMPLKWNGMELE